MSKKWIPFFLWVKTIIAETLVTGKDFEKKNEILMWRKILLRKVKSFIDNHQNHAEKKLFIQEKQILYNHLYIPEILAKLKLVIMIIIEHFLYKGWWFQATSVKETKFMFRKQLFQWWLKIVASKYGYLTCFQWVQSSDIYVFIHFKKWRPVLASHEEKT